MPQSTTQQTLDLPCDHCHLRFRRREHLNRHLIRHSGARPHECTVCHKSFPRRDTLKRHMVTHGEDAISALENIDVLPRACQSCAKRKIRCDNRLPSCSSCETKSISCVYSATINHSSTLASPQVALLSSAPVDSIASTPGLPIPELDFSASQPSPNWDDFLLSPRAYGFPFLVDLDGEGSFNSLSHGASANVTSPTRLQNAFSTSPSTLDASLVTGDVISADEEDILSSQYFKHVPSMPTATYARLVQFVQDEVLLDVTGNNNLELPPLRYLDNHVQLYFEYFHPRFPLVHKPTFAAHDSTWPLVLAMAAIGCQFSLSSIHTKHMASLTELCHKVLQKDITRFDGVNPLALAQSLLLIHNLILFGGCRKSVIRLQLYRNMLMVICRQYLLPNGSIYVDRSSTSEPQEPWRNWAEQEAKDRLICFTWMTECLHVVFFASPPLLSINELQVRLPCTEEWWHATEQQWQILRARTTSEDALSAPLFGTVMDHISQTHNLPTDIGESVPSIMTLSCFTQGTGMLHLLQSTSSINVDSVQSQTVSAFSEVMQCRLQALIESHRGDESVQRSEPALKQDTLNLSSLVVILSFTPTQLLYPFSRWQTTASGSDTARQQLTSKTSSETRRAQQCLLHAAQLYKRLRGVDFLTHFDPLCLLIATLYIWAYIELAVPRIWNTQIVHPQKTTRVDAELAEADLEAWLQVDSMQEPYITGIGSLCTERSLTRLLKESARIASASSGRSRLAGGLAQIFQDLALESTN